MDGLNGVYEISKKAHLKVKIKFFFFEFQDTLCMNWDHCEIIKIPWLFAQK